MNHVTLIGHLTRDPEVRCTQSGISVCTFTLAVDRRFAKRDAGDGRQTADFIPVVAWRKLAEICGNNLSKGRLVGIEGSMQVRSYQAQDGSKRYITEVIADEVEFMGKKEGQQEVKAPDPEEQVPDEDIPF